MRKTSFFLGVVAFALFNFQLLLTEENSNSYYTIVLGSMKYKINAERRIFDLNEKGLAPETYKMNVNSNSMYRICIGRFIDLGEANSSKEELVKATGIKGAWILKLNSNIKPIILFPRESIVKSMRNENKNLNQKIAKENESKDETVKRIKIEQSKAEEQKKLAQEKQSKAEEQKRLDQENQSKAEEQKRLAQENQSKAEEQKRLAQEKQSKAEEQKRLAQEKQSKAEEQKRLAQEKKIKAEEQKRLAAIEKNRIKEAEKLAKKENEKMLELKKQAEIDEYNRQAEIKRKLAMENQKNEESKRLTDLKAKENEAKKADSIKANLMVEKIEADKKRIEAEREFATEERNRLEKLRQTSIAKSDLPTSDNIQVTEKPDIQTPISPSSSSTTSTSGEKPTIAPPQSLESFMDFYYNFLLAAGKGDAKLIDAFIDNSFGLYLFYSKDKIIHVAENNKLTAILDMPDFNGIKSEFQNDLKLLSEDFLFGDIPSYSCEQGKFEKDGYFISKILPEKTNFSNVVQYYEKTVNRKDLTKREIRNYDNLQMLIRVGIVNTNSKLIKGYYFTRFNGEWYLRLIDLATPCE